MATAPKFSTDQLWVIPFGKLTNEATDKQRFYTDKCCVCNRHFRPTPFEKRADGNWHPTVTAIGNICPNCKKAGAAVFIKNENIANIRIDGHGRITFRIWIDENWEEAELLPDCSFAMTLKQLHNIYKILDGELKQCIPPDVTDKQRVAIAITREQLLKLAC